MEEVKPFENYVRRYVKIGRLPVETPLSTHPSLTLVRQGWVGCRNLRDTCEKSKIRRGFYPMRIKKLTYDLLHAARKHFLHAFSKNI